MAAELVTGDTGSALQVTCTDRETGLPIDLTGATVRLQWEGSAGIIEREMDKPNPAAGIARYKFQAGEIEAPKMVFEVEITFGNGDVITNPELIEVETREQIA